MSEYTVVSFALPEDVKFEKVEKAYYKLWDAGGFIKIGTHSYELMVSELNLGESWSILNKLSKKFGILFIVKYGYFRGR